MRLISATEMPKPMEMNRLRMSFKDVGVALLKGHGARPRRDLAVEPLERANLGSVSRTEAGGPGRPRRQSWRIWERGCILRSSARRRLMADPKPARLELSVQGEPGADADQVDREARQLMAQTARAGPRSRGAGTGGSSLRGQGWRGLCPGESADGGAAERDLTADGVPEILDAAPKGANHQGQNRVRGSFRRDGVRSGDFLASGDEFPGELDHEETGERRRFKPWNGSSR